MRALWLAPLLLVVELPASASTCSTSFISTLTCGGTPASGTLEAGWHITAGPRITTDPSHFSTYTCASVQPPGAIVPQGGPDAIYKFVCPSTGPVTVKLDNADCEFDLFIMNSTCTGGSDCFFGSETPRPELGEEITFNCVSGRTYWFVAEAYEVYYDPLNGGCNLKTAGIVSTFDTAYRIQADCAERCTGGVDDDLDGRIDCADSDCLGTASCCDVDGDGYDAIGGTCLGSDCDDGDPNRNPGRVEVPVDGIDQDCDGVDSCYRDLDGDGYGGTTVIDGAGLTCTSSGGLSRTSDDCRDSGGGASLIYPGATDTPGDGIDQNCDGVDQCFRDVDGDGYGSLITTPGPDLSCAGEPGLAAVGGDCQDTGAGAADIRPGATEVCNGVDDDCDTLIDDADPGRTGATTWYRDADGDGFGDAAVTLAVCQAPLGYVLNPSDCRDTGAGAASIYPAAPEIPADGIDQDCDLRDHCYLDQDRDGFGGATAAAGNNMVCGDVAGEADDDDDCADTGPDAASIFPGAPETCNGRDDDCDLLVDDADPSRTGGSSWYPDDDGDGYGDSARGQQRCTQPGGTVADGRDCRDTGAGAASVYPGAPEIPADGADQDCDGKDHCWVDADRDSFGGLTAAAGDNLVCGDAPGESAVSTDCVDTGAGAAAIFPGATEQCNGFDDDCDGLVDDADPGRAGAVTWYLDLDGDGFAGSVSTVVACSPPAGGSLTADDCRDVGAGAAGAYPGAAEIVADGQDQDCDGKDHCWVDADRDGFGGGTSAPGDNLVCGDVAGESALTGDCLDAGAGAAAVFPGALEVCNGVDDDCDLLTDDADTVVGAPTWFADLDGDGFAGSGVSAQTCTAPTGWRAVPDDCDDTLFAVNPAGLEACNGLDDDCDGRVDGDDTLAIPLIGFLDGDGDGFGDSESPTALPGCEAVPGVALTGDDCDDGEPLIGPGGEEIPYDGLDQDCDGADLTDVDRDGYVGGPGGVDCVDFDRLIHPGVSELADGVDEDCDGLVDDGTTWYDDDRDGFAEEGGDCDDAAAGTNPAAIEVCDGVDQDCDGIVDEGTVCFDDDGDDLTELEGDCNDADANIRPGVPEYVGTGIDSNCDGVISGIDVDGDGYAVTGGDCEDEDPEIFPGAVERPDGVDDDCDGLIDEGTPLRDDDLDGYSEVQGDCDDGDAFVNPLTVEDPGNGRDDDCDGLADEGGRWFDDDADGFAEEGGDCDDGNGAVFPYAIETTNGVDDDCDGQIDEGSYDLDEDGWTVTQGDCNDADGWANPGLEEICDGIDNDCDAAVDEGCTGREEEGEVEEEPARCDHTGGRGLGALGLALLVAGRRRRAA
jgi:hypothetical protein